jgi:hypothetical protein
MTKFDYEYDDDDDDVSWRVVKMCGNIGRQSPSAMLLKFFRPLLPQ